MSFEDDQMWVRQVLGAADPVRETPQDAYGQVRAAVADRAAGKHAAPAQHQPPTAIGYRRSGPRKVLAAAAASLVLLMLAMPLVAVASEPAWAVEQLPDGRIRVEYSSTFGHGPDPAGLLEELRAHGVDARSREVSRLSPLAHGRIVGLITTFNARDANIENGLPDPADYGMHDTERGYLLDPKPFRKADGVVIIEIGAAPWSE